jgi:PPK2 family polyphosphate:nucleotide phosphotransferase
MGLIPIHDGDKKVDLSKIDPGDCGSETKQEAEQKTATLLAELAELQDLLYAAGETAVLIVLQGLDTAGKDGSIQHVMGAMNPQSCRVASFKVPTPVETAHDFLWRIHAETPAHGTVAIFNRSHYEDVLVVRVHNLVSEQVWRSRYDKINAFEKLVSDASTIILKFMLHISKDEQKKRLLEREKDPAKAWKLSPLDWKERELWDKYHEAYEDAINHCSTDYAPWYVVPADHKWYRNLILAETLVETLRPHRKSWEQRLRTVGSEELKQLRALRQNH